MGRLGHSTETWKVSLADYTCCPALQLSRYPCVHICHVCSVAKVKCHTVRGWRAQLGLPIAGASSQGLVESIAEQPDGIDLRLVIAVRSGTRACASFARASFARAGFARASARASSRAEPSDSRVLDLLVRAYPTLRLVPTMSSRSTERS